MGLAEKSSISEGVAVVAGWDGQNYTVRSRHAVPLREQWLHFPLLTCASATKVLQFFEGFAAFY